MRSSTSNIALPDLVNLGWVLHDTNRLAEAEPLLRRALGARRKLRTQL